MSGTPRKRLPAYGAALRERCRRGPPPLCVHLIYGFRWKDEAVCSWSNAPGMPAPHPLLALKPSDYVPGTLDFSVLTGLKVCVFDQGGVRPEFASSSRIETVNVEMNALLALLGEVAAFAAEVQVYPDAASWSSAHELAAMTRAKRGEWPFWWSDDIEKKHAERRARWYDAVYRLATDRAA